MSTTIEVGDLALYRSSIDFAHYKRLLSMKGVPQQTFVELRVAPGKKPRVKSPGWVRLTRCRVKTDYPVLCEVHGAEEGGVLVFAIADHMEMLTEPLEGPITLHFFSRSGSKAHIQATLDWSVLI